jgi:hypothetical protein
VLTLANLRELDFYARQGALFKVGPVEFSQVGSAQVNDFQVFEAL